MRNFKNLIANWEYTMIKSDMKNRKKGQIFMEKSYDLAYTHL